eukprot:Sspe_Gene.27565::Locus_11951_Transcript_1_1_Confidence_1.000_Length_1820::g.27565::m.27565
MSDQQSFRLRRQSAASANLRNTAQVRRRSSAKDELQMTWLDRLSLPRASRVDLVADRMPSRKWSSAPTDDVRHRRQRSLRQMSESRSPLKFLGTPRSTPLSGTGFGSSSFTAMERLSLAEMRIRRQQGVLEAVQRLQRVGRALTERERVARDFAAVRAVQNRAARRIQSFMFEAVGWKRARRRIRVFHKCRTIAWEIGRCNLFATRLLQREVRKHIPRWRARRDLVLRQVQGALKFQKIYRGCRSRRRVQLMRSTKCLYEALEDDIRLGRRDIEIQEERGRLRLRHVHSEMLRTRSSPKPVVVGKMAFFPSSFRELVDREGSHRDAVEKEEAGGFRVLLRAFDRDVVLATAQAQIRVGRQIEDSLRDTRIKATARALLQGAEAVRREKKQHKEGKEPFRWYSHGKRQPAVDHNEHAVHIPGEIALDIPTRPHSGAVSALSEGVLKALHSMWPDPSTHHFRQSRHLLVVPGLASMGFVGWGKRMVLGHPPCTPFLAESPVPSRGNMSSQGISTLPTSPPVSQLSCYYTPYEVPLNKAIPTPPPTKPRPQSAPTFRRSRCL